MRNGNALWYPGTARGINDVRQMIATQGREHFVWFDRFVRLTLKSLNEGGLIHVQNRRQRRRRVIDKLGDQRVGADQATRRTVRQHKAQAIFWVVWVER